MLKTLRLKRYHGRTAQALVEFTLTAMVFLLLIVMIIEVARIMQAYVTIQHAAREAARYASTGDFMDKYGINQLAGWNEARNTADPLQSIRPCWPLFYDDPYPHAQPRTELGLVDSVLWEPYRDARTCSVEETAIQSMAGLVLSPNAKQDEPDAYEIIVSGTADDIDPMEGEFLRGTGSLDGEGRPILSAPIPYVNYYDDENWPSEKDPTKYIWKDSNQSNSRGYAGDPGKKTQVQIWYRIRMITPFLMNIAPSVRLYAIATMTVETFGSTSLQRKAVPPPPEPRPLVSKADLTPPDIEVTGVVCPTTTESGEFIAPGDIVTCTVTVKNIGQTNSSSSKLRAYVTDATPPGILEVPFLDDVKDSVIAFSPDDILPLVAGGMLARTIDVEVELPSGADGDYYLYVWADCHLDPDVNPSEHNDGVIPEIAPGFEDLERINNNVGVSNPIPVKAVADLGVVKTVDPENPPFGGPVVYTITVTNYGPSPATDVLVTDPLDTRLTYVSDLASVGDYDPGSGLWNIGDLSAPSDPPTGTNIATLQITANVDSDTTPIPNTAEAFSSVSEPTPDGHLNSSSKPVSPGSVDMTVTKAVITPSSAEVDFGTSAPVTYRVRVTNSSTATATNVHVRDNLPTQFLEGAGNISATWPSGTCGISGRAIDCAIGDLGGGTSVDVTITAVVDPAVAAGAVIPNFAILSSNQLPIDKNSDVVNVTVRGADIEVEKDATVSSVNEGQSFTYRITAHNRGPSDAGNVVVRDVLPSTIQYVSDDDATYDPASGDWEWNAGSLAAYSSKTLNIVVYAKMGTLGTTIRNTAERVSSTPPQPVGGGQPDSDYFDVEVVADSTELVLTKDVNPTGIVYPGTTLTYTLTLTNTGTVDVTDRVVQDTNLRNAFLPTPPFGPLLQYVSATATHGSFDPATGQWTEIDLTVGQTATATITVRALGRQDNDYTFDNYASVVTDPGTDLAHASIQINWPDPIFINAGDRNHGCAQSVWGGEDPVLAKDYTWRVTSPPNVWSRSGGTLEDLIDLSDFHFIGHPESPITNLTLAGQNLFGCRTSTRARPGFDFSYDFTNLLPGNWRVVLVFADHTTNSYGYRLLTVSVDNGTTNQILPGMSSFDIVAAIRGQPGFTYNRNQVNPPGLNNDYYDVHYIVKTFDNIVVDSSGQLKILFTNADGSEWWNNHGTHVNGLGIEYVSP